VCVFSTFCFAIFERAIDAGVLHTWCRDMRAAARALCVLHVSVCLGSCCVVIRDMFFFNVMKVMVWF